MSTHPYVSDWRESHLSEWRETDMAEHITLEAPELRPCNQVAAVPTSTGLRMLGAHTHAVKAPDGVECANCINEAKAKGKTS